MIIREIDFRQAIQVYTQYLKDNNIAPLVDVNEAVKLAITVIENHNELLEYKTLHTSSEWSEEDGDVLWWLVPLQEAPYCGMPTDDGWPFDEGEVVVWSRIPNPIVPKELDT